MSSQPPLFLTQSDIHDILTWVAVIARLGVAYGAPLKPEATPPRVMARGDKVWMRALAAVSGSGKLMGAKLIARGRSLRSSHLIALWDQADAHLVCLIDGKPLTAVRTAGTSALAVDLLHPRRPVKVAVLGSGSEATMHLRAVAAIREVTSVRVYSPTPAHRTAFASRFVADFGVAAEPVSDPRSAVAGADIVLAAARSHDETPILNGAWLEPGMTVVSIGSTLPEQREVDPEVIARANIIVADVPEEVSHETGDMLAAAAAGVPYADKLVSLADLTAGVVKGRQRDDDIALFKSVGSSLQDIAIAELCYQEACRSNRGTLLPIELSDKAK